MVYINLGDLIVDDSAFSDFISICFVGIYQHFLKENTTRF